VLVNRTVLPAIVPVHTQMPADKRGSCMCFFWLSVKRDSVSIVLGILFAVDFSHATQFGMGKVVKL